jgi:hypothetical protein
MGKCIHTHTHTHDQSDKDGILVRLEGMRIQQSISGNIHTYIYTYIHTYTHTIRATTTAFSTKSRGRVYSNRHAATAPLCSLTAPLSHAGRARHSLACASSGQAADVYLTRSVCLSASLPACLELLELFSKEVWVYIRVYLCVRLLFNAVPGL